MDQPICRKYEPHDIMRMKMEGGVCPKFVSWRVPSMRSTRMVKFKKLLIRRGYETGNYEKFGRWVFSIKDKCLVCKSYLGAYDLPKIKYP